MSGGSVKAFPRFLEKYPKELKTQEGIESLAGCKNRVNGNGSLLRIP
jgi:hypothetical protein